MFTKNAVLLQTLRQAITYIVPCKKTNNYEKALREMQTLCAGCSKGAKKICPAADPLPGGTGRPKFNQLEMVTTFT